MLNIKCPYCGFRDESEFSCGGEAHIIRPGYEIKLTDEEWAELMDMPLTKFKKVVSLVKTMA